MAVLLEIKAVPQSGRQKLIRDKSGIIKCFLKSAPEDGKANREIIEFLSKILDISRQDISILQGATARKKVIKIDTNFSKTTILSQLGLENEQQTM
jgi:uncharacterized protein (TIGR00251 family)